MQTVLLADRLIDGVHDTPIADAALIAEGARITYAGPASEVRWAPDAQVLRVPGGTIMPGLIDVHVHISYDGGPRTTSQVVGGVTSPADAAMRGLSNAQRMLQFGYTTLRDLNAPSDVSLRLRNQINAGRFEGPRLIVCGQGLCITAGHMDKGERPAERVGVCDTPDEFRRAVRYWIKAGVDLIKLNTDVGSLRDPEHPYTQEMSTEEIAAACNEAHRLGRKVASHTAGGPPIEQALLAGVDTIEHGHWLTDRAIELFLERGAYYVPTLIVNTRNFDYPPEVLGASAASLGWCRKAYEAKWDSLARAKSAGVKIAAGSDAGFLVHHGENAAELAEMVKGGFSEMQAIRAATAVAAELLELQEQIGTLEPGKLADVAVVACNPLEDIALLQQEQSFRYVLRDGRLVKGQL